MPWYNTIAGDPNEFHTDTRVPAVGSPVTAQSVEYSTQDLLDNTANLKVTKAELDGGNTFTGTQVFTDPAQFQGGIDTDRVEFVTPRTRTVSISAMDMRVYHSEFTSGHFTIAYPSTMSDSVRATIQFTKLGASPAIAWIVGSIMLPGNYEIDLYNCSVRFRGAAGQTWGYKAEIFSSGSDRRITNPQHTFTFGVSPTYDVRLWDGGDSGDRYISSYNLPSQKLVFGVQLSTNPGTPPGAGSFNRLEGAYITLSLRGNMIRGA